MKTYTFYASGMHCKACTVLIESELSEIPGVKKVSASLGNSTVRVEGDFPAVPDEAGVAEILSKPLEPHGYSLAAGKPGKQISWKEFAVAIPVAAVFIGAFMLLQRSGIIESASISADGYGSAFFIGLVASVSTCMAVVGGLVLSMSANFSKGGDAVWPQTIFHASRLAAFFILGGLTGMAGSVFQLGVAGNLVLNALVAAALVFLGLNLLDIMKFSFALPTSLGRRIHGLKNANHTLTPLALGAATFFLPCGFTQAMQISALSSGSFFTGAMTMFIFALGTLPVLALISFGPSGITKKAQSGTFFKTAGLIVLFFAAVNFLNALALAGIIQPIL